MMAANARTKLPAHNKPAIEGCRHRGFSANKPHSPWQAVKAISEEDKNQRADQSESANSSVAKVKHAKRMALVRFMSEGLTLKSNRLPERAACRQSG